MQAVNIKKQLNIIGASLLLIFAVPFNSLAVGESSLPIPTQIPELEEQVSAEMSPKFPKPEENVKISLSAFGTDINSAEITWLVDGRIVRQGKGEKTFEFKAGKSGTLTTVTAEITPLNGNKVTKTFNIKPQTVDIIWEANTYTPPFYKGKSMYTPEEKIIFVAMPNVTNSSGNLLDPKSFVYKWSQNNTVLGSLSGLGQNVLPYTGNILMRGVETRVEVKTDENSTATNYITLKPTFPETNIYEDSPLYGILFNKEVSGNFEFGNAEERSLSVFPYFFGGGSRLTSNVVYNWSINYSKIEVPTDQSKMTFRNVDNLAGKSVIKVSNKNQNKFLQKSEAGTVINFEKTDKTFDF